jgi:hypothetical protein
MTFVTVADCARAWNSRPTNERNGATTIRESRHRAMRESSFIVPVQKYGNLHGIATKRVPALIHSDQSDIARLLDFRASSSYVVSEVVLFALSILQS